MSLLPKTTGNRQMKEECARACDYLQKTSGLPLNVETIKQTYRIKIDGKDILVMDYRKSPVFVDLLSYFLSSWHRWQAGG